MVWMDANNKRHNHFHKQQHIAVVTMGVKLGGETRGYTRFRTIAEMLVEQGFRVDLITTNFQHWDKAHRDTTQECYQGLPYRILFIEEPGYSKNLDLTRIKSHAQAAKNLRRLFDTIAGPYDLIYAEIPPNDVARVCAEFAVENNIPFVADINDLWPEAMSITIKNRLLKKIAMPIISATTSFAADARVTYQLLSGAIGTSDEYTARPALDRAEPYPRATVYVGNKLAEFDAGAARYLGEIDKPSAEFWVTYAGTLGASYDLHTLVKAAAIIRNQAAQKSELAFLRVKILGDGPERGSLEALTHELDAPVDFCGYVEFPQMAAYLSLSDIVVNSLKKDAAQSIVGKIGDYLASGSPIINTGSSKEFCNKVNKDGFGINVEAENPQALAQAITDLCHRKSQRKMMGSKGRAIAEKEFDQPRSYQKISDLIKTLL
ncbi:MAG: glycosyltransferase family 4 protein [Eggerthellaceae bacterium]|nr:glycosyltransferase family 4 protein [Eggerthellaceae bacterium]